MSFESEDISNESTGNCRICQLFPCYNAEIHTLWPYSERKNLSVSEKKTLTVESSNDTASRRPSGLYLTASTSSVIFSVLTWTSASCLVLYWISVNRCSERSARDSRLSPHPDD